MSHEKDKVTLVRCTKCNRTFKIKMTQDLLSTVDKYPFPVVLMHSATDSSEVHTLVAYVDKQFRARHIEYLVGKRVFITPFILYNPQKLILQANKTLSN